MEIRNRMPDVVKLRCNACQDFLGMVIKPNWQQELYAIAKKAVETHHHADNYISAYEKMRTVGIENYKIEDMDVSFITQVVRFCGSIVSVDKDTKEALIRLKDDRNLTNHSNENEIDEELYLRGLLALCDLKNFVRTVDKKEISIDDEKRLQFRQKYICAIDELQNIIDDERICLIQHKKEMDGDIKRILESNNPDRMWLSILESYMKRCVDINKDIAGYYEFILKAADAGVVQAFSSAAEYYYEKEKYIETEKLLKVICDFENNKYKYNAVDAMRLADIYINHMEDKAEIGMGIISRLIEMGCNIIKDESNNRYVLISKSEYAKGREIFYIEFA